MKTQVTFTRNTDIRELHRIIINARKARSLNCFNVMHNEYDRAKFLVSFFYYHDIFDDQDFYRFRDEIVNEEYEGNEVTF